MYYEKGKDEESENHRFYLILLFRGGEMWKCASRKSMFQMSCEKHKGKVVSGVKAIAFVKGILHPGPYF